MASNTMEVIEINHKNLLSVACVAITSIIDMSCHRPLTEETLTAFINILDNIFYSDLKYDGDIRKIKSNHPWRALAYVGRTLVGCATLTRLVHNIQLMDHLEHDFAKLRALFKMALMQQALQVILTFIYQSRQCLKNFYLDYAFIMSEHFDQLIQATAGLNSLEFSLDLKSDGFNFIGAYPIDYTPYMKCSLSPETLLTVKCECKGRLDRIQPECHWRLSFQRLQEKHQFVAAQKDCLGEDLRKKEAELAKQKQLLGECLQANHQLEDVILELQVCLTLLHEQYRCELKRVGANDAAVQPPTLRNGRLTCKQLTSDSALPVATAESIGIPFQLPIASSPDSIRAVIHRPLPSILAVEAAIEATEYSVHCEEDDLSVNVRASMEDNEAIACVAPDTCTQLGVLTLDADHSGNSVTSSTDAYRHILASTHSNHQTGVQEEADSDQCFVIPSTVSSGTPNSFCSGQSPIRIADMTVMARPPITSYFSRYVLKPRCTTVTPDVSKAYALIEQETGVKLGEKPSGLFEMSPPGKTAVVAAFCTQSSDTTSTDDKVKLRCQRASFDITDDPTSNMVDTLSQCDSCEQLPTQLDYYQLTSQSEDFYNSSG